MFRKLILHRNKISGKNVEYTYIKYVFYLMTAEIYSGTKIVQSSPNII